MTLLWLLALCVLGAASAVAIRRAGDDGYEDGYEDGWSDGYDLGFTQGERGDAYQEKARWQPRTRP